MKPAAAQEQLRAVRLDVERTMEMLVCASPQALDRCSRILDSAGRQLAALQKSLGEEARDPAVWKEAQWLRFSVHRASRLLEGAARFHFDWCRLRDTLTAGYTDRGHPAPAPESHRISVQA